MGSIMANLTVGLDTQHIFYIAGDINSDGILGLSSLETSINLKNGTLGCQETVQTLKYATQVVIQGDTTVPPNHEVVFPASTDL